MFGLSPSLRLQVQSQILGGDSTPTLTATFSRVMHISTGADVSPTPSIEQSAMVFERGRGRDRDRDRDFGDRGSFVGDRGSYDGRRNIVDKGPGQCKHCGRNNHISEK